MKILLIFPQADHQTGLFIKRAFVDLGHEVDCFDPKEEDISLAFGAFCESHPDMVFCSRTAGLALPVQRMKFWRPEIVTMCWNVDKRDSIVEFGPKLMELFGSVDILYTIAKGNIEEYQKHFPRVKVLHLQQGCDLAVHHPEELTAEDHAKYDCDVMFAGDYESTLHHGRREIIKALQEMNKAWVKVNFYGKEKKVFDSEHNKACQCAKICIGHNGWAHLPLSMSVRDYKIMAAGGFLLTEECPEIEEWFGGYYKKVMFYKYASELQEQIMRWVSPKSEEQRKRMAIEGMDFVHKNHKYIDRMALVIKDVEEWVSTHTRS